MPRWLKVNALDLEQSKVALALLWRSNLTADGITGPESKTADLRRTRRYRRDQAGNCSLVL